MQDEKENLGAEFHKLPVGVLTTSPFKSVLPLAPSRGGDVDSKVFTFVRPRDRSALQTLELKTAFAITTLSELPWRCG